MKKTLSMPLLALILLFGGCTNGSEKDSQPSPEDEQTSSQKPNIEEDDDAQVEITDWQGNYVYLHDKIEGLLTISEQDNTQFTYKLVAFEKNEENETLAEVEYNGEGAIDKGQATLNDKNKDCSIVLTQDELTLTAKMNGTDCAQELDLAGDYKNIVAEETPPLFNMKDKSIYINGLTLTDTPAETKALWGNPDPIEKNADDIYLADQTFHEYKSKNMYITYYDHKLYAMTVATANNTLDEITSSFQGEHYRDKHSDTEFFLVPENGQLLIYRESQLNPSSHELLLIHSDENFLYHVNAGSFEKVEKE